MKSHIKTIELIDGSDEWLLERDKRIGGSDLGTLMGLNKYKASIQLFYEKVGIYLPLKISSRPIFFGNYLESNAAELWEYYDGDPESYIDNYYAGNKFRTCYTPKGIVVNDKLPWLHASIDRLMHKGSVNIISGETMDFEAILECKTASQAAMQTWEDGIPPAYIVQVMQYMMICEVEYAEFSILKANFNGFDLEVIPVEYSKTLADQIKEQSHHFWYDLVEPARKLQKERSVCEVKRDYRGAHDLLSQIQALEPLPDGSESYKNFLSAKEMEDPEIAQGEQEHLELCREVKMIQAVKKKLEEQETLCKSKLMRDMLGRNIYKMEVGEKSYCSLKSRKGSDNLTFKVQLPPVDADLVEEQVDKLTLQY